MVMLISLSDISLHESQLDFAAAGGGRNALVSSVG